MILFWQVASVTHLETLIPDHLPHHEVDDNVFYPAPMWEVEVAAGVAATTIPWDEQTGEAKQVQLAQNDKLVMLDDSMIEAHALYLNAGDLNEAAGAGMHLVKLPFKGIRLLDPVQFDLKRTAVTEGVKITYTRREVTRMQWKRMKEVMGYDGEEEREEA